MSSLFFVDGPAMGKILEGEPLAGVETTDVQLKLRPMTGNVLQPHHTTKVGYYVRYSWSEDFRLALYTCDPDYARRQLKDGKP